MLQPYAPGQVSIAALLPRGRGKRLRSNELADARGGAIDEQMRTAIVACPDGTATRESTGNAKDLRWVRQWLETLGFRVKQLTFSSVLQDNEVSSRVDLAVVYYTHYPDIVYALRRKFKCVVVARAANVEHWQAMERKQHPGDVQRIERQQLMSLRAIDGILSISDSEIQAYWNDLHRNVIHLPYLLPKFFTTSIRGREWHLRRKEVLVMLGRLDEPIGLNQLEGVRLLTENMKACEECKDQYTIRVTCATYVGNNRGISIGHVEDAAATMASVRAVLNPGTLGRGLKTTLVDAILVGAHSFTTETIYHRSPSYLRKHLTLMDTLEDCCSIRRSMTSPPCLSPTVLQADILHLAHQAARKLNTILLQ